MALKSKVTEYGRINDLIYGCITKNGDGSYEIREKDAKKNLPKILEILRSMKDKRDLGLTSDGFTDLDTVIGTLSDNRSGLQVQVSQVFWFMSVWANQQ